MFSKQLSDKVIIRKVEQVKNEFGEYRDAYMDIETNALVRFTRSRMFDKKHGIIEETQLLVFLPSDCEVTKEDRILYKGKEYDVMSIVPILDFKGDTVFIEVRGRERG